MDLSPFRFDAPIEPGDLLGRQEEAAELIRLAVDRRVVSVAAPRRYGKTSLLRRVSSDLVAEHDFIVAKVDLLGLAGPADFLSRFGSAWRRAVAGERKLRRAAEQRFGGLASLGVTVLGSGFQVGFRERERSDVISALHAILDLPGEVDRPVLVVLDEFQALHDAWPAGEGVLRSHTQAAEQAGRVGYVFAGSQPSLLSAAFADAGRAFYNQVVQVPLGRLDDHTLAEGIAARFELTDRDVGTALGPLLLLAAGHPQRAMFLAHLLWDRTRRGSGAVEATYEATVARARAWVADEMEAIWLPLTPPSRAALRAVHRHGAATLAAAVREAGIGKHTLQEAQESLRVRGLIEADAARTGPRQGVRYRLVDPLLGDWMDHRGRG